MFDVALSPELKVWLDAHPDTFFPLVVLGMCDEPGGHLGFHSFWSDIESKMTVREREVLQRHLDRVCRLFVEVISRQSDELRLLGDLPRSD